MHIFVGVELRVIGGLVVVKAADYSVVVDVELSVHRDGARARTTPHHTKDANRKH